MLCMEQTFACRAFHTVWVRILSVTNKYSQKSLPWACDTTCAETHAEPFSPLNFRPTAPARCSLCVNDLCRPGPLLFILRRITFRGATRRYPAGWEHSLNVWRVTYHNNILTQTVADDPRRRSSSLGSLLWLGGYLARIINEEWLY